MTEGLSLQPLTDTPPQLAVKLGYWLEGYDVNEIDGMVLVEHHRHQLATIEDDVRRALRRVYGTEWRQHVAGLD